jgi:hypothetical protein
MHNDEQCAMRFSVNCNEQQSYNDSDRKQRYVCHHNGKSIINGLQRIDGYIHRNNGKRRNIANLSVEEEWHFRRHKQCNVLVCRSDKQRRDQLHCNRIDRVLFSFG